MPASQMQKEDQLPIGSMKLSPVAEVTRCQVDVDDMLVDSRGLATPVEKEAVLPVAFELCRMDGRVALFYRNRKDNPQVWFQDLSCTWHFISNSFTDYFRLMVTHLGLPRWLYVFTATGLDPAAKQWFRFIAPERLASDMRWASHRRPGSAGRQPPEATKQGGGASSVGGAHRSKLNWSQIERTSTQAGPSKAKGSKKKETGEKEAVSGKAGGSKANMSSRPGSASRARPVSAK